MVKGPDPVGKGRLYEEHRSLREAWESFVKNNYKKWVSLILMAFLLNQYVKSSYYNVTLEPEQQVI